MIEIKKRECPTLLLVLLIVFSQNVYAFSPLATGHWGAIRNVVQLFLLMDLFILLMVHRRIKLKLLCVYLAFMCSMLFGMVLHKDFAGTYWLLECTIAFLVIVLYTENSIIDKFERIIFVICAVYSLGYLVTRLHLELLHSPLYSILERFHLIWGHSSMYPYYVAGVVPLRAYAFFREPGVYQMFLILALVIEWIVRNKKRRLHIGLYIFAIWATHSTTGYLCLGLVMLMAAIKYMTNSRQVMLYMLGALAVLIPILPSLLGNIIQKFTASGAEAHSWLSRQASILTNLFFLKENPLFGVGVSHVFENFADVTKSIFNLQAGAYSITDDTNTILLFFAAFGTFTGLLFVFGTYKLCRHILDKNILSLIMFLIFVFLYAGEAVNSTCYPYILFLMGISTKDGVDL